MQKQYFILLVHAHEHTRTSMVLIYLACCRLISVVDGGSESELLQADVLTLTQVLFLRLHSRRLLFMFLTAVV